MTPIRNEIMRFAEALEDQMRYNESRGKTDEWKEADPEFLFSRLMDEVKELRDEIYPSKEIAGKIRPVLRVQEKIQHESKDVGSLAFFIWYNSCLREVRSWEARNG
jgi:NTP pyrophosphatase (non-canonical NTP hydrolase)